jgi:hypothetical protein
MVHCIVIIAALCESNIGLLEFGVRAIQGSILLTKKLLFLHNGLQNIYCFT